MDKMSQHDIMKVLSTRKRGMTAIEMSKKLGIGYSSAHRKLLILRAKGFVIATKVKVKNYYAQRYKAK